MKFTTLLKEYINIGRDTFDINIEALRAINDSEFFIKRVKEELDKGNGTVQVQCLKGDIATVYGTGTSNVDPATNELINGLQIPVNVLIRVGL